MDVVEVVAGVVARQGVLQGDDERPHVGHPTHGIVELADQGPQCGGAAHASGEGVADDGAEVVEAQRRQRHGECHGVVDPAGVLLAGAGGPGGSELGQGQGQAGGWIDGADGGVGGCKVGGVRRSEEVVDVRVLLHAVCRAHVALEAGGEGAEMVHGGAVAEDEEDVPVHAAAPQDPLEPVVLRADGHAAEGVVDVVALQVDGLIGPGGTHAVERGSDGVGGRQRDRGEVVRRDERVDGETGEGGAVHDRAVRDGRGPGEALLLDGGQGVGDERQVRPCLVQGRDIDEAAGSEGLGQEGVDDVRVCVCGRVVVAVEVTARAMVVQRRAIRSGVWQAHEA
jgi:hypothetical protein